MEVFKVDSKETGKMVFVGAWEDAEFCWKDQLGLLAKKKHPKTELQAHFNKFGADDLVMTVTAKVKQENVSKELIKLLRPVVEEAVVEKDKETADIKVRKTRKKK